MSEKGERIKKHKLAVMETVGGWKVQHRKYSQWYCYNYAWCRGGVLDSPGRPLCKVDTCLITGCTPEVGIISYGNCN